MKFHCLITSFLSQNLERLTYEHSVRKKTLKQQIEDMKF